MSVKGKKYKPRKKAVRKKRVIVKKARVPKTRNAGKWSEREYFQAIRSGLRRTFRFWGPMMKALELSSRPYRGPNKRQKKEYKCAKCGNWYKRTEVQIDHIEECGSLSKYEDIIPFIQRLTKEELSSYQILCLDCHKTKTTEYLKTKKK